MHYKNLLIRTAFLALLPVAANAQSIKVHGFIKNPLADSVTISFDNNEIYYEPKSVAAHLNKDGQFSMEVPAYHAFNEYTFTNGDQATEFFAAPGADLAISVDASSFDTTLHYDGKGKEIANFMAIHMLEYSFLNHFGASANALESKEPDEFYTGLKALEQKQLDFLTKYGKDLPASFKNYWKAYYEYSVYNTVLEYPYMHEMMTQHTYSVKIKPENYKITEKVPAKFDDKYIGMQPYMNYIERYYANKLGAQGVTTTPDNPYVTEDSVTVLAYKNMPKESAKLMIASRQYRAIKYEPIARAETKIAEFKKMFPNSHEAAVLENKLDRVKKFDAGKPEVDFAFKTIDGKDTKLSELKGKVVLVDFWASWCGPCIGEMPSAKKVREHFKGKDVAFVYVSIDDNVDSWKKAIEKYEIEGVHTISQGGWSSSIAKLYGIESVPSYFLIDKKGNYATKQVPRPSDSEKLIAEIEKLLN